MFYVLDELIVGLYMVDVEKFICVLYWLVVGGYLVVVIEYDFDVIVEVDWILDFGFEGGDVGGWVVVVGMLEVVVVSGSYMGVVLKFVLGWLC